MYIYKKWVGISAYLINAIEVLIDLVFLALCSILLYHLLTHVRTAKIVINFIPNFTTRKSKCYQIVLFLNEVIGPYCFDDSTNFCVSFRTSKM